jgi:hypothetical protein
LALAVPLSRFTPRVGGGSAFYVRHRGGAFFYFVGGGINPTTSRFEFAERD